MSSESKEGVAVTQFLDIYRRLVNPNLLFVSVDLSGAQSGFVIFFVKLTFLAIVDFFVFRFDKTIEPGHDNDVYIAGYSDQILRFVAERGDSGQLLHVEKVDSAYNLKATPTGLQLIPGAKRKMAKRDSIERPLKLTNFLPR